MLTGLAPQSGPGPTALTRITWKLTRKTDSDTPVFLPFTQQVSESQVCIRKTMEAVSKTDTVPAPRVLYRVQRCPVELSAIMENMQIESG